MSDTNIRLTPELGGIDMKGSGPLKCATISAASWIEQVLLPTICQQEIDAYHDEPEISHALKRLKQFILSRQDEWKGK